MGKPKPIARSILAATVLAEAVTLYVIIIWRLTRPAWPEVGVWYSCALYVLPVAVLMGILAAKPGRTLLQLNLLALAGYVGVAVAAAGAYAVFGIPIFAIIVWPPMFVATWALEAWTRRLK